MGFKFNFKRNKGKKIVIALGGNALGDTPKEQEAAVKITAKAIINLILQGNQVVVCHGNGPQVGMISLAFENALKVNKNTPELPLSLSVAMTQGYIGLHLQQAIKNELAENNLDIPVTTIVTETIVSQADEAFNLPSKPIGAFYKKEEAKKLAKTEGWTVMEDAGRGWRRVVPSPKPIDILQKKILLSAIKESVVIAGGGGGVPTYIHNGKYKVVDAVIDKDFTAEKIAEVIKADIFMIVTAVDGVWKNFGKSDAKKIISPTVKYLEKLLSMHEFAKGSMEPKVLAVVKFIKQNPTKKACITSLEKVNEAFKGKAGSWINFH